VLVLWPGWLAGQLLAVGLTADTFAGRLAVGSAPVLAGWLGGQLVLCLVRLFISALDFQKANGSTCDNWHRGKATLREQHKHAAHAISVTSS